MATANTTFTQEQIDNLSGVAKKYGGFDNSNFQSAVDGKYGAGSFDSLKTSLSAIKTPPAPSLAQNEANRIANEMAIANKLGQTYNVDTDKFQA